MLDFNSICLMCFQLIYILKIIFINKTYMLLVIILFAFYFMNHFKKLFVRINLQVGGVIVVTISQPTSRRSDRWSWLNFNNFVYGWIPLASCRWNSLTLMTDSFRMSVKYQNQYLVKLIKTETKKYCLL